MTYCDDARSRAAELSLEDAARKVPILEPTSMRPRGTPQRLQQRRVRALKLLKDGLQPSDVARNVGVTARSVRRWREAAIHEGVAGVRARPARGRPSKLSAADKRVLQRYLLTRKLPRRRLTWKSTPAVDRRLQRLLSRKVGAYHQVGDYWPVEWTPETVAAAILRIFHVRYHRNHVRRLLRQLGWRPRYGKHGWEWVHRSGVTPE